MTSYTRKPLSHHNVRPAGVHVDTIVIHSMHCDGNFDALSCIDALDAHCVASHYLIDREGLVFLLVEEQDRAWHAGDSKMPEILGGATVVNDFSIGIELTGSEELPFEETQYNSLSELIADICSRHPIKFIVGHSHIAVPEGRKQDPGSMFEWKRLSSKLEEAGINVLVYGNET